MGLRVAFIVDKSAPIFIGGYESRIFYLAKELQKVHDVRIYTSLASQSIKIDGIPFVRVSPTTFQEKLRGSRSLAHSAIFGTALLRNPFSRWRPDVVIVESIPYLHLGAMSRWAGSTGSAMMLNVSEAWFSYPFTPGPLGRPATSIIRHLLQDGLSWAEVALAISSVTAQSLRHHYRARRVEIVPMGIHLDNIRSPRPCDPSLRRYDFVTLCRLVNIKRVSDFVEALSLLRRDFGWKGRACVIGDGPLRPALEKQAKRLGVSGQIDFLGFLTGDEKIAALHSGIVFVLPSEREGFSIATLEALACGLPSIVAIPTHPEVFGTSDLVTDNLNGRYYPVGDIGALANRMAELLGSPQKLAEQSQEAVRKASKYDWSVVGDTLNSFVVEAASRSLGGNTLVHAT